MDALSRAIEIMGGAKATADRLEVSVQAVYFWRSGDRRLPAEQCPRIERETGGAVRCEELRPDVEWDVLREHAANSEQREAA